MSDFDFDKRPARERKPRSEWTGLGLFLTVFSAFTLAMVVGVAVYITGWHLYLNWYAFPEIQRQQKAIWDRK